MINTNMRYRQNFILGAALIVSAGLPTEVVVFMRGLFGVVLLLPLLMRRWKQDVLTTSVFHLHLLRATLGVSAMYCFFYALANLQLADGMLLKMTAWVLQVSPWYYSLKVNSTGSRWSDWRGVCLLPVPR